MSKRPLPHPLKKLLSVQPLYFLIAALLSLTVCIFALRANNEHMSRLRQAVYAADQSGYGVQEALQNLQAYVTRHMNTNLETGNTAVYPPIQLKYSYDRLVQARSDQLAQSNPQVYSAAQTYCEQKNPGDLSARTRVPCIEEYVQSHGVALPVISDALYKFSFVSPPWSPDLAGWSLVVTIILGLLFLLSLIHRLVYRQK